MLGASTLALGLATLAGPGEPAAAAGTDWVVTALPGLGSAVARGIDGDVVVGEQAGSPFSYDLRTCTVTDLGTLGGTGGIATGVSGTTVVGQSATAGGAPHAFAYDLATSGPMRDLGTIDSGIYSKALGVDGSRVVGEAITGQGYMYGFTVDGTGSMSALSAFRQAADVDGTIVVGTAGRSPVAMVQDLAGAPARELGTLQGGTTSRATGVDAGVVVGASDTTLAGMEHAFRYVLPNGPLQDLGTLGGGTSEATGVSGPLVVGRSLTATSDSHAFVQDSSAGGELVDLGAGMAFAVDGTRIVGTAAGNAVMWTPRDQEPRCGSATAVSLTVSGGGQAGTSITVPQGSAVTAQAVLSGTSIASAGGTLTYSAHTDAACTAGTVAAGTKQVSAGKVGASDPLTPEPGSYWWKAAYGGDADHDPSTACVGPVVVTAVAPGEPVVRFSTDALTVAEEAAEVHLEAVQTGDASGTATVGYATADGSATAGPDYTATSGTLTFGPGVTSRTILVPVIDDGTAEPDETFTVSLASPAGATLGAPATVSVTVTASDGAPVVDALLSASRTRGYVGDDVFNLSGRGQTVTRVVHRGHTATFYARIVNDGPGTATFALASGRAPSGTRVTFARGGRDITAAVTSRTGWRVRLAPGHAATVVIRATVRHRTGAHATKVVRVEALLPGGTIGDVVRAVTRVHP